MVEECWRAFSNYWQWIMNAIKKQIIIKYIEQRRTVKPEVELLELLSLNTFEWEKSKVKNVSKRACSYLVSKIFLQSPEFFEYFIIFNTQIQVVCVTQRDRWQCPWIYYLKKQIVHIQAKIIGITWTQTITYFFKVCVYSLFPFECVCVCLFVSLNNL